MKYLCAIKDIFDKSIVSYSVSKFMGMSLVLDTVKKAIEKVPFEQRKNLILHSDQGFHFTNIVYTNLLAKNNITQSISAKGSCVDNVPIESFFSALKSKCIYLNKQLKCKDIEKIKELAPLKFRELTLNSFFF